MSLKDPAAFGMAYVSPWNPQECSVYPVKNERYINLNRHPKWGIFEKALKEGSLSLAQLARSDFIFPSGQEIEVYHKSVIGYPQAFLPHRLGLATLQPTRQLEIVQGLDATRMGYAANSFPIVMTGMPFDQEAFLAQNEGKKVVATKNFVSDRLLYNATLLEKGENIPNLLLSQGPQGDTTVSVFVKMLIDAKVTHIVALGMLRTTPQFCTYWPSEKNVPFKIFGATIALVNEQVIQTDTDKWQRLFKRTLQLDIANVGTRLIHHYQWIGYDFADQHPSIPVLHKLQKELIGLNEKETLLIHCHDGMVRSSAVALTFLAVKEIERQKKKGVEMGQIQVNLIDLAFRLYTERPAIERGADLKPIFQYLREKGMSVSFDDHDDEDNFVDAE